MLWASRCLVPECDGATLTREARDALWQRTLAARYGPSRKTVAKWRGRASTADAAMGPRNPRSIVLTPTEEAMIVSIRQPPLTSPFAELDRDLRGR